MEGSGQYEVRESEETVECQRDKRGGRDGREETRFDEGERRGPEIEAGTRGHDIDTVEYDIEIQSNSSSGERRERRR